MIVIATVSKVCRVALLWLVFLTSTSPSVPCRWKVARSLWRLSSVKAYPPMIEKHQTQRDACSLCRAVKSVAAELVPL